MNSEYTLDLFQDFLQFLFFFYSIDKHVVLVIVYTIPHLMMDVPLNVYVLETVSKFELGANVNKRAAGVCTCRCRF